MSFFQNKNVLLIHDMWMPGFMYGDTDDWYAIFIALRTFDVKSITIYIPHDVSIYGDTRYAKCVEIMGLDVEPYKYGSNRNVINYTHHDIASIVSKSDIVGLMAPLSHIYDSELKCLLNNLPPCKYTFTQGESGKYNRTASRDIERFLEMAVPYKSNDTKFKHDGTNYTFEELQGIVPNDIITNIMVPYKLYKLFCPPPLDNPYVPMLYMNMGTNICAIQELAVQMNVPGVHIPVNPTMVEENNIIINRLADFELPVQFYAIKNKPELNEPMKQSFTTMVYVARLFGMYDTIRLHNLSNAPPLKALPPLNSFTNPMWDANTLILVNQKI